MKRRSALAAVAAITLTVAGQWTGSPAQALSGGRCTESPTATSVSVTLSAGTTRIICLAGGADTVTINAVPADDSLAGTRLILVKAAGVGSSLEVVWNAGNSGFGDPFESDRGEFSIIRPPSFAGVTAAVGAAPNDTGFVWASCGSNVQYKDAPTYGDWTGDAGSTPRFITWSTGLPNSSDC